MSADADAVCGAEYGGRSRIGPTSATGTGTGSGTPGPARSSWRSRSCREGSYFPDWLLERRRRAEAALVTVVATCYLLGVSTRRMEKLVRDAGDHQAVEVAGVARWPGPGRAGRGVPHPAAGRRAVHVRRGGRADDEGPGGRPGRERGALLATGVNADGHREILGLTSPPSRTTRAGWRSSATWSPAAWPGSRWSPATRTPAWSRRSPRTCPAPRGKGAGRTTRRTS